MWDPVPWAVGGGASHTPNVGRNVAHAAFGGLEGIASPQACEVRELAAPGASVRVFPGTVAIKNRATGISDEMYVGRLPTEDVVAIAATDSVSPRSDLIIARVENPYLPGEPWPDPADPANGPYIFTRVISGVPAGTTSVEELGLGYSAIPLARIDLPVSTNTITQDMITDLRVLARQERATDSTIVAPSGTETLTSTVYVNWPTEATLTADVPSWATHARVKVIIGGVETGASGAGPYNVGGNLRIELDGSANNVQSVATTYNVSHDAGVDRTMLMCGGEVAIDSADRGKPATIRVQGKKNSGSTSLTSKSGTLVSIDVEFINSAESNV